MQKSITTTRTAHYYTNGKSNAKTVWFLLHGYGYLAKYFIRKLTPIANEDTLIVAPEGLSKFYKNGVGYDGRIGASWMTSDDREDEITDQINYLNKLYLAVMKENPNAKVNILGFSQGGATASRWIADGKIKYDNVILWSSAFPEDLDLKTLPKDSNTFVLFGDDDHFISKEKIVAYEQFLNQSEFDCTLIKFKGGHDIYKDILLEQTEKYNWG